MGSQTKIIRDSMYIMLASRYFVPLLVLLSIARAAKLDDNSLYKVVEDLSGNETKEKSSGDVATCSDVMARNGMNFSSFAKHASHGLHSLYLEEIRHFFEPNATEDNKIPVVNKNLSSQQAILFDAPLAGYDKHWGTMALKVMSFFMLNDHPDFFHQGLNTLEKVAHQYHMHEIFSAAAPIYEKMKENPPTDQHLCGCVNDVVGNGILIAMATIAQELKYYQSKRTPRNVILSREDGLRYFADDYRKKRSTEEAEIDPAEIIALEEIYLNNPTAETAHNLVKQRPWKGNTLVGPEQWVIFEAMLTDSMPNVEELNDFVTFLYCRLNKPNVDHPTELFDLYA